MADPVFFQTEADFRRWLDVNHESATELLVGFWKKGSGQPSIDWPQARDQALCFGWIDGHRKSLGDHSYTIRFTPRRKDSIWSKVNVDRIAALTLAGLMTRRGTEAFSQRKKVGIYAYEKEPTSLEADETRKFQAHEDAWVDWQKRPPSYRTSATHWITSAKRPATRAKRLAELIDACAAGRVLPQYDWQKKP